MSGEVDFPPGWLRENIRAARASFDMLPEGLKSCAPDWSPLMPADLSVDLAALDALFQAAGALVRQARYVRCDRHHEVESRAVIALADARRAAEPAIAALRRRLEIGAAAVEVIDADDAEKAADAAWFKPGRRVEDIALLDALQAANARLDAARAKLRALRETTDV